LLRVVRRLSVDPARVPAGHAQFNAGCGELYSLWRVAYVLVVVVVDGWRVWQSPPAGGCRWALVRCVRWGLLVYALGHD